MIGTAKRTAGAIERGHVELGFYPDGGPVTSPVLVAGGRKDGPTIMVQACIHGPEVVGPLSIHKFLKSLNLEELSGTIVCLMEANPLGFNGRCRLTPQDGINLNRVFPGDPDGHLSEQLAYQLLQLSLKTADTLLDLHSGGDLSTTPHYVVFHNDGTEAGKEAERLARCTGSPNLWNSSTLSRFLAGGMGTHFTNGGKPAIVLESGGGARVTEEDFERMTSGIANVCRGMGMLPGQTPRLERYRLGTAGYHMKAHRGGLFIPKVMPGDNVTKGQHLADIYDLFGDVVQEVRCPLDEAWIGSVRRPHMPIYNGEQVFELVGHGGYDPE